ncbi:hypothetical protein EGW08_005728, partial [Elysia chlorotica]
QLAAQACSLIGSKSLDSWKTVRKDNLNAALALVGHPDLSAPLLSNLKTVDACPDARVVHLSCKESECGERKFDPMKSLIAGGEITPYGKWPWVVSLSYLNKPICGGVIIGRRWVLTAAHCIKSAAHGRSKVDFSSVPFYFTVTAGKTHISVSGPGTDTGTDQSSLPSGSGGSQGSADPHTLRVAKIFLHPELREIGGRILNWDLALLELDTETPDGSHMTGSGLSRDGLEYSELVQPVCLPNHGEEFSAMSRCYIAGWGLLNDLHYQRVHDLRDSRMLVWSESRCSRSRSKYEAPIDTNSTLCGGFIDSQTPAACEGDSGGPLMCLDSNSGRYKLAGIISQGGSECGTATLNKNRFVRVSTATNWIRGIMGNS